MSGTPSLFAGIGAQLLDNNGKPLSGGKLFTYLAGTTTPIAVYTSEAATTAHPNPIILDSAGRVPTGEIWLKEGDTPYYKFVVKTSTDVLIATYDFVPGTYNSEILENFIDSLAAPSGSSLVGFIQAGTGAVATTVQTKLRETVSFKDFGAVGDGLADDTAAVLNCLNSGAKVVDGQGLTYKLTSNISPNSADIAIQNCSFDISSITGGGPAFSFVGTQGAEVTLTSDILKGSNSITVGSTTGFSADQYAWLSSDTIFDISAGVVLGQVVKIKSVNSATSITISDDVLYDFTVSASSKISSLNLKKNISIRDVGFLGANTGIQTAIRFDKCFNVFVDNCRFDFVDYVSILFSRCVNATTVNTSMRYARSIGLSYGIAVANGCYSVKIANCYGEDQRHMVTVGDNDGVNLFVSVANCHAAAQRDAGLDSHPAGDFILFDGNTVELVGARADGIICQGLNAVITNNIVVGNISVGIRHQLLPEIGTGSSVISGNTINNFGDTDVTDTGIYIEQSSGSGAEMIGVTISNNIISVAAELGVYVFAVSGNIKNVAITGNVLNSSASIYACQLRANAGFSIQNFAITGNVFNASGTANIYLLGTGVPSIINGTISGNVINGGVNGIRAIQAKDVSITGNFNSATTRKVFVDVGSLDISMDRRVSTVAAATNATYVVVDQDEFITVNRVTTVTVTLPPAQNWTARALSIKTLQAQTVVSASANVVPMTGGAAGTDILPATAGAWILCRSDGSNWVILQRG